MLNENGNENGYELPNKKRIEIKTVNNNKRIDKMKIAF